MAETKGPASKDASGSIDPKMVRRLADILIDTGLTEIEVEQGDLRIRVARQVAAAAAQPVSYAGAPAPVTAPPAGAPPAIVAAEPEIAGEPVHSPMVGTVYLQ